MRSVLTIILLGCCSFVFAQQKKKARASQAHTATARTGNAYTISHSANGFCTGGTLALTGNPAPPSGYGLQWTLNGNAIAGQTTLNHAASQVGAYSLYAYRTSLPADTIRYDTVSVVQYALPTAGFTSTPSSQCSNVPVVFNNTSTGGVSYAWSF
ncbi:MAG: hypothetical protein EOP50_05105, partial [Sphingobacteriales bacterium]